MKKEMKMKSQIVTNDQEKKLLLPQEVCALLTISRKTLQRLVDSGELQGIKVRGRLRFWMSQIQEYLMKNVTNKK
jgi:excisionase family DNA binding protein